ncbi:zinc finger BED domain-containing protein 4-like [Channa argus]|uniref:zinc finger BED domain-containing protein 4-like n=1 Tax=Channa argus TaxID=215402 RepID=UPI003521A3B0
MKFVDPNYKMPRCKTLKNRIITQIYKDVQSDLKKTLQTVDSVVLTTDMWTSRTTQAYLTVTCHFVHNWQMMIAVITDNGANVASAVHKAGWTHYPCFAHTLNLVVKDAIKAVPQVVNLLQKCSNIVSFFHHSTKATQKLADIQKQLNKPEHKLVQSVETRWNSPFYMLDRFLEQKEPVTIALCVLGRNDLRLSSVEILLRETKTPLKWWKDHERTFPVLSCLVKRYLGIVASSVPSERVFSKTGEIISHKRNHLKGNNVNMLLFLNQNLSHK